MPDDKALPTWNRNYEIGRDEIDREHELIFSALMDFQVAVDNNLGERLIRQVFGVLYSFVKNHFRNEEQIMRDAGFALLDAHRDQHDYFLTQLGELRTRFDDGETIGPALGALFSRYLNRHIPNWDAEIVNPAPGAAHITSR